MGDRPPRCWSCGHFFSNSLASPWPSQVYKALARWAKVWIHQVNALKEASLSRRRGLKSCLTVSRAGGENWETRGEERGTGFEDCQTERYDFKAGRDHFTHNFRWILPHYLPHCLHLHHYAAYHTPGQPSFDHGRFQWQPTLHHRNLPKIQQLLCALPPLE